jgi:hypothetical protein
MSTSIDGINGSLGSLLKSLTSGSSSSVNAGALSGSADDGISDVVTLLGGGDSSGTTSSLASLLNGSSCYCPPASMYDTLLSAASSNLLSLNPTLLQLLVAAAESSAPASSGASGIKSVVDTVSGSNLITMDSETLLSMVAGETATSTD